MRVILPLKLRFTYFIKLLRSKLTVKLVRARVRRRSELCDRSLDRQRLEFLYERLGLWARLRKLIGEAVGWTEILQQLCLVLSAVLRLRTPRKNAGPARGETELEDISSIH
jgi:hypothetical protein